MNQLLTSPLFWTMVIIIALVGHVFLFAWFGYIYDIIDGYYDVKYWNEFGDNYIRGWVIFIFLVSIIIGLYKAGEIIAHSFMR